MKTLNKIMIGLGVIAASSLLVLFVDMASAFPRYVMEPAIVRRVVPDEGGYIGTDKMTLIRFDDGFTTQIGGDRGEPGERIMAPRQRGVTTVFGIFETKS